MALAYEKECMYYTVAQIFDGPQTPQKWVVFLFSNKSMFCWDTLI